MDNKKGYSAKEKIIDILEYARRVPRGPVDLCIGTTEERFSALRNRTHTAKQYEFKKCIALLR